MRVFVVAVSQARVMRSHITNVTLQRSETVKAKKSEMKAARTLGVVVVVFLLCSCPYYSFAVASVNNLVGATSSLHTTTNLLLLSLAVTDFLVGFLQMPAAILVFRGCWFLGDIMCAAIYFVGYLIVSVSVGNMVLISIDRYMAICDPMFYSTKVTLRRVQLCVCLYFLKQPENYKLCHGECEVINSYAEGIVDLVVTFLGPILIIILLYMRVFVVAVSQARAMRSHITTVTFQRSETVKAKKSEMKAARTLGVVVLVFLLCSCPYYSFAVASVNDLVGATSSPIEIWLLYFNSCLNPVIYVFFYPWFRKSIKHIITLQILQPGSSEANLM
uniref:G-protein coupled receptors family 1 profile domain-containing protein n=1 Tax=Seriola dumerili TaxID=41447 RepID=A0A3B4UR79_SERDU